MPDNSTKSAGGNSTASTMREWFEANRRWASLLIVGTVFLLCGTVFPSFSVTTLPTASTSR